MSTPEAPAITLPPYDQSELVESSRFRDVIDYSKRFIGRGALVLGLAAGSGAAVGAATEMLDPHPTTASADTGGYPDSAAPCVANNNNQTTGTGYWCANYDWGYYTRDSQGNITGHTTNSSRGYGYRNCTDWVAFRIPQLVQENVPSGLGHAQDWDDHAPAGTVDSTPEPGDIAVWEIPPGQTYGHVAVVESVNANGTVNVSEYNKGRDGIYGARPNVTADHYIDLNGTGKGLNGEAWPTPTDTDGDGINDSQDQCPAVPGIAALYGCRPSDIDRDGIADLAVINTVNTGTGKVEVHPLAGSGGYVNWIDHDPTVAGYLNSTQQTLMGDINNDGKPDLLVVNTTNTGTGKIEVHPISGAGSHYDGNWIGHYVTPADYLTANQRLVMADVNFDGKDDLLVVNIANTGTGKVEIHPLDAATNFSTWVDHWVTPANYLSATDLVLAGDSDHDGKAEVFIVNTANTGTGKLEVHRLDPVTHFSTWQGHDVVTPMAAGSLRPDQRLVVGDANADGMDDLVVVNTDGAQSGSGKVEVHPLSGATHYSAWLGHHIVTTLTSLDSTQRLAMGG